MIESLYLVVVVLLLVLAALDLFVGVSNDAVNFLNSAVGTRIAPLTVVLLVASAGVLLGSTFSSGMMEVARSGMFHPELFNFHEIIIIFSAVMIADILLLSIFNSLGMPTSTTVSIIFELLGAAVIAAAYKLNEQGLSFQEIINYIKLDKTATIVSAILLSVVISFIGGMLVQFFCRILFSFKFNSSVKYLGGLFTGLSLTAIAYFLIIKGAKGASFMKPEYISFIHEHQASILWGFFISFFILGQVMVMLKLNIFKLIILSGTFALAFSFAGNDLVNFVGVPLAALDAYNQWQSSGISADSLNMQSLTESSKAGTFWLVLSGIIMCVTLWISKKARRVIQTAINLSSSRQGQREQFGASTIGRVVTRMGLMVSRTVYKTTPKPITNLIGSRYIKPKVAKDEIPLPFDYVRACINLVVASALISFATSLKLPLSTTYVTFMVAMGTSFADGAWDRDSAVYRISGVVAVISGWFLTGFSAFVFAFITGLILFVGGPVVLLGAIVLVLGIIIYSDFIKKEKVSTASTILNATSDKEILDTVAKAVPLYYEQNLECLKRTIDNFFSDNELSLRRARNKAFNVLEQVSQERSAYYGLSLEAFDDDKTLKEKLSGKSIDSKFFFYHVFSNLCEACKSVKTLSDSAVNHISNRHVIFEGQMKENILGLYSKLNSVSSYMQSIANDPSTENIEAFLKQVKKVNRRIDKCQKELVFIIANSNVSMHSSEMYLNFLQPFRDIANRYAAMAMQANALSEIVKGKTIENSTTSLVQTSVIPASLSSNNEDLVNKIENEHFDKDELDFEKIDNPTPDENSLDDNNLNKEASPIETEPCSALNKGENK